MRTKNGHCWTSWNAKNSARRNVCYWKMNSEGCIRHCDTIYYSNRYRRRTLDANLSIRKRRNCYPARTQYSPPGIHWSYTRQISGVSMDASLGYRKLPMTLRRICHQ